MFRDVYFFFSSRRRHTRSLCDWSSDVCSSDLFQVLLTTDKNIQYQQNLAGRKISVLVLANSQWPVVRLHLGSIATAVNAAKLGGYTEVEIPKREVQPLGCCARVLSPCDWIQAHVSVV